MNFTSEAPLGSDATAEVATGMLEPVINLANGTLVRSGGDSEEQKEGLQRGQWRTADVPGLVELRANKDSEGGPFCLLSRYTFDHLYPHQRAGVAWMARLWQAKCGGILADDMGLGKTVQVCALLEGARKVGATHALLLVPVTLLEQWKTEARKWCPGWPVYTYHGSAKKRDLALRRISRPLGGILLTSYDMLGNADSPLFEVLVSDALSPKCVRNARTATKHWLVDDDDLDEAGQNGAEAQVVPELPPSKLPRVGYAIPWDIVVCDEAHRMKNISTLLGKSIRQVRSRCRFLLTGTPVQNVLGDLWALMDFAQPGLLGNHVTFVKHFSDPIERGSVRSATPFQVQLKKHLSEQLRSLINPHLLRRTKSNACLLSASDGAIMECGASLAKEDQTVGYTDEDDPQMKRLPPKRETVVWLSPSEEQVKAYRKVLEKSDVIREACTKQKLGVEVFRAIGLLKRLCNHPALLIPCPNPQSWAALLANANGQRTVGVDASAAISDDSRSSVSSAVPPESLALVAGGAGDGLTFSDDARAGPIVESSLRRLPRSVEAILAQSSKLRCLAALLPALAARGHRTLVFSQSVKMLDLVQICCLKPNGLRCLLIDGLTDPVARAEKVNKFQQQVERFQCMLLSTTVGGVGLNLTGADRVVLVDPAWNPASDAQAVDRAFRIGQNREVRVYRLIMSGLIEDKMFRLQVFKMGLTRTALEGADQFRYFAAREIRALFEWTDPAEGETRRMLAEKRGGDADDVVMRHAEEDGACDGWFGPGPAVGLSDFSLLCDRFEVDEEGCDDVCFPQVVEAKQKLDAADRKMRHALEARRAAKTHRDTVLNELEKANAVFELAKQKRARAMQVLKERRGELVHAHSGEFLVQLHLARDAKETELAAAVTARASAEAEEVESKQKRVELKEAVVVAREALKVACRSEREAAAERQALHAMYSKVEKAQLLMEEAKNSATQILQAEEYDAGQVERAFEHTRKGASGS